jgi:hypothetical protein
MHDIATTTAVGWKPVFDGSSGLNCRALSACRNVTVFGQGKGQEAEGTLVGLLSMLL